MPKRTWPVVFVVSAIVLIVSGLHVLDARADQWRSSLGPQAVQAIQFNSPNSLATWVTSFYFILASMIALQVFALRQHRQDDYRGTYRVWIWLAAWLIWASIATVANVNLLVSSIAQFAIKAPALQTSGLAWVSIKIALVVLIVARWGYEVRSCRFSLAIVVATGGTLCAAILGDWPSFEHAVAAWLPSVSNSLTLVAAGLSVLAGITYGRRIYLEAHGLRSNWRLGTNRDTSPPEMQSVAAVVKQKSAAEPKRLSASGKSETQTGRKHQQRTPGLDARPARPQPAAKTAGMTGGPSSRISHSDRQLLELADEDAEGLSKSQRRRLRKLRRRENRAA